MALFAWKDSYSVGNPTLDEHHKKLVGLVNDFYDKLTDKSEDSATKSAKVFAELKRYTLLHFKTEEEMMEKANLPKLAEHKKLHEKLVASVLEYEQKIKNKEVVMPIAIGSFLKDWLNNHILNEDKQYSSYLK